MMIADELDECRGVRFPIFREAFQILENSTQTSWRKDGHRILGIFVEVGVENPHVLEINIAFDFEEIPSEVMQLQHGKNVRLTCHGLLEGLGVLVKTGSCPGKNFAMIEKP